MTTQGYFWAPGPAEWDRVVAACEKAGVMGLDTEFYNCDPTKESTVGRARVHLWSVAVPHGGLHPRGYQRAFGSVLPASALSFGPIVRLLEGERVRKAVHNLPVDAHALHTHDVALRGGVNTLSLARWHWPELVASAGGPGFGLKALKVVLLDKKPATAYKDLFQELYDHVRTSTRKVRTCVCGDKPCWKRGPQHMRQETQEETVYVTPKMRPVPLESVVEGHPLWERALAYAAEDAVDALELWDLAAGQKTTRPMPW